MKDIYNPFMVGLDLSKKVADIDEHIRNKDCVNSDHIIHTTTFDTRSGVDQTTSLVKAYLSGYYENTPIDINISSKVTEPQKAYINFDICINITYNLDS